MSGPSDAPDRLRTETDRLRVDFLKTDLGVCFTFVELAATSFADKQWETAEQAIVHCENGYATIDRFLSDPNHSTHLTGQEKDELMFGLGRLRARLDEVYRLRRQTE